MSPSHHTRLAVERCRIRDADASDGRAIAALHAASWRTAYRGILAEPYLAGPVESERAAVWRARFAPPLSPDQVVVVAEAEQGGPPLGFCCILAGHHPVFGSLIDNLHVRPDLSRLGLGRRLLRAGAGGVAAGAHPAAPFHLTVFERNTRAIAAYERWGGALAERLESDEPDGAQIGRAHV